MHAGRNWDDAVGESGPEDPDLSLISFQAARRSAAGRARPTSRCTTSATARSAPTTSACSAKGSKRIVGETRRQGGQAPFVGLMSHGCSGDIWRRDYTKPAGERNDKITIDDYTTGLLDIADGGLQEDRVSRRRRPGDGRDAHDAEVSRARQAAARMGRADRDRDGRPACRRRSRKFTPASRSSCTSGNRRRSSCKALRIGDIGIATTPNETYALTGLKIKAAEPAASRRW